MSTLGIAHHRVKAGLGRACKAALTEGSYVLSWWAVDGRGGTSSGIGYTPRSTLRQPDAGTLTTGGGYTLAGVFWHGGAVSVPEMKVYLP